MEPANAADRKSIRRQEKAARLAERQRAEVIRSIMSSTQGRAWLWDVLSSTAMFHTTFNGDALASAFQEGRRSVGLAFLADIMAHSPDLYIQAMREANERNIRPDPQPASADPLAERRGSPLPDGGDSGAVADSSPDEADDADDTPSGWQSPGRDVYTPS